MASKKEKALLEDSKGLIKKGLIKLQAAMKLMGIKPKLLHYIGVAVDIQRNITSIYTTDKSPIYKGPDVKTQASNAKEAWLLNPSAVVKEYRKNFPKSVSSVDLESWLNDKQILEIAKRNAIVEFKALIRKEREQRRGNVQSKPEAGK